MCALYHATPSPTSTWRALAASVTGTSHLHSGKGCEDAHAYYIHEASPLLLLAAADGAGTAIYAATGAQTAVQAVLDAANLLLAGQREPDQPDQWSSILSLILRATHSRLEQLVEEHRGYSQCEQGQQTAPQAATPPPLREFATTLLLAIVTPHWLATLQVGDGAIVIYQQDEKIVSLTPRSQHEYVNETFFVTDEDYLSEANYSSLFCSTLRGIALLTDGLQTIAMHNTDNSPHAPFFKQMFDFAHNPDMTEAKLRRFLESERVCARTDDDKTLVLAVQQ